MAVGLSATAFVAGCGNNSPENTLRVGDDQWVYVTKPVTQHYVNADR